MGRPRKYKSVLLFVCGASFTLIAIYSVLGTTLRTAAYIHGIFGNLVIGLAEGLFFSHQYRIPRRKGFPRMILANYTAFVICVLATLTGQGIGKDISIYWGWIFLIITTVAVSIGFLLVKMFFILYSFRNRSSTILRTIRATVTTQIPLILLLAIWYFPTWTISIYTESSLTDHIPATRSYPGVCYYISTIDDQIYRSRLDGSDCTLVYEKEPDQTITRLLVEPSQRHRHFDINAIIRTEHGERKVAVIRDAGTIPDEWDHLSDFQTYQANVTDLRKNDMRFRQVIAGVGRQKGLRIVAPQPANSDGFILPSSGDNYSLALRTPFLWWPMKQATIVPNDLIVFECGRQICVFEPNERILDLLAWGTSPVVVLER